jgi:UDP-glucose 4-epimerase
MLALVTGGAGFIGSNLVDALVAQGDEVRVLDDLSTGYRDNVSDGVELVEASVDDGDAVAKAMVGVETVFHQAAARAVLKSVEDPLSTDSTNVHGTVTVLKAAVDAGVRRLVYASSSSIYGGVGPRPTPEAAPLLPRSPYAVSKLAAEHYCRIFFELYGLETVALRYFNVFGPRQRPDSMYAAVIPLFIAALEQGESPVVHGDGQQTRDFTYVSDTVAANLAAASAPADACAGRVFNIAAGRETALIDMLHMLERIIGRSVAPTFEPARAGDVRHSCADASLAAEHLGWRAAVSVEDGLEMTYRWFNERAQA